MQTLKTLFLTILLSIFALIYCDSTTTAEDCNKVFDSNDKFNLYECKCFQDLRICKISLTILQKCNDTSPGKVFRNETNCEMMYSECSLADKDECKSGMCECLKSMVSCFSQHICKPLSPSIISKRSHSVGAFSGFSELFNEHFVGMIQK